MLVVTGGAGFIGSVVLALANEQGIDNILVVDNLGTSEKWQNLVKRSYVDYMHRDIFFERMVKGTLPHDIEAIVHLGACSSTTEQDSDFLYKNNVEYTKAICRFSLERGIHCILASSAATYGDGKQGFSDQVEGLKRLRPLNRYGYSKHLVDLWLLREGLLDRIVSLKFFNVYGPNEYHKGEMRSVVAKAYDAIIKTGSLSLFASTEEGCADGDQKRDFVYVKDCAELILWLLSKRSITGIHNVGTGSARTFNDLGRAAFAALGRSPNITYIPMPDILRGKYQSYTCADMSWLAKEHCPVRFRSLEEGVTDYIQNYLTQDDRFC